MGRTFKEEPKGNSDVETVGTMPRHRNRRLEGSKYSHWVTVPPPCETFRVVETNFQPLARNSGEENQGRWVEEGETLTIERKVLQELKELSKNQDKRKGISPAKNKKKGTNGDDTREKARKRSKSTQITDLQISPHRPLGWTEYRTEYRFGTIRPIDKPVGFS